MPRGNKRKSQLHTGRACRESNVKISDSSDSFDDEYRMDIDDQELSFIVEICKDWGVQLPAKVKLDEIREIPSKHRAFQNVSQSHSIFLKVFCSI